MEMGCIGRTILTQNGNGRVDVGPDEVDQSCLQFEDVDGWSGGDSDHSQPTSLQRAERMEPCVCFMEEAATQWANICSEDKDVGFNKGPRGRGNYSKCYCSCRRCCGDPMPVTGRGIDAEEKNCVVEEKTLDIAGILGISLEGRIRRFVHAFEGCLLRSLAVKKTVNSKVRKNRRGLES